MLSALVEARLTALSPLATAGLMALPGAARTLVEQLTASLGEKQENLSNFASARHIVRVRRKLLQLARNYGRVARDGVRIDFPVSHSLLAEMVGSSRETVTRAIDELQRTGSSPGPGTATDCSCRRSRSRPRPEPTRPGWTPGCDRDHSVAGAGDSYARRDRGKAADLAVIGRVARQVGHARRRAARRLRGVRDRQRHACRRLTERGEAVRCRRRRPQREEQPRPVPRRAEHLPPRHVRRPGLLGRRAAAASRDRRREERRRRPWPQPEGRAGRRAQGRLGGDPEGDGGRDQGRQGRPERPGGDAGAAEAECRRRRQGLLRPRRPADVGRPHLCVLPLHGRRLVRARHRSPPRRLAEPRPERRRDHRAGAEQEAAHRRPRRRRGDGRTRSSPAGGRASSTRCSSSTARHSGPTERRRRR